MAHNLTFMYWNCQGIRSKVEELTKFLQNSPIDLICLNESFLKDNNRFNINGYNCIRKDRLIGRLGGLAVLVRNGLKFNQINCPTTLLMECMGVEIANGTGKLIIINAYLPGGSSNTEITRHYQNDLLALTNTNDAYFIVGDLNSRHSQWNCSNNNTAGNILQTLAATNNFSVYYPNDHTYCPLSVYMSNSTIDLVLTNHKVNLLSIETKSLFSSDHLPVLCRADISISYERVIRHNYRKADWSKFRNYIDTELDTFFLNPINTTRDIDTSIDKIQDLILRAQDLSIPKESSGKDNIFIDPITKGLILHRNYFRRRFLRYHDPIDNDICIVLRKQINKRFETLRAERWEKKLTDCEQDHTGVFKIAKSLKRKKFEIPTLLNTIVSDKDKAHIIAKQFHENHENPLKNRLKSHTKYIEDTTKHFISERCPPPNQLFNYLETAAIIKELKTNKSPGDDSIFPKLIKNLPNRAIFFLNHIFSTCLLLNYFPVKWKIAKVIPLPKPGKPTDDPRSYRPISLLSCIGKIYEKLILNKLLDHITTNNIIPNVQFGFRKSHSTSLQILRIYKEVRQKLSQGFSTGFVAFDIEKAFDRVWHSGLIFKMIQYNFPRNLIHTISSFLANRSFRVRVGDALSNPFDINYGVPQGSVLSPVLYNLYTADIPRLKHCSLAVFADDTGIYSSAKFYKKIKKHLELDSKTLSRYFLKWKIALNSQKTEAIFFTRRTKKQKPGLNGFINIGGKRVLWKENIKYLGCHFDPRMTLKIHVNKLVTKSIVALKCLYPLIHRRSVLPTRIKNNMYKTYFRPILTYPNIVLEKISKTNKKIVQTQQNKLLRLLNNKDRSYSTAKIHRETKVPLIEDHLNKASERAELRAMDSTNPLVSNIFNS